MLDCVREEAKPTDDPLGGPGGCGLACDPIEPEHDGSGKLCLRELADDPAAVVSQACWSVRCGPNQAGASADVAGCCGGPGGVTEGGAPLPDPCAQAHCEDGAATFVGGRCTCSDSTGGGMPGGPIVIPGRPFGT